MFHLKTQFVLQNEHVITVIETNQLTLYRAKVPVCTEIITKHKYSAGRMCSS